jgi:hypothetical protein
MSTATEISLSDEAALSWYFGLGLSIYERSTFGAILAKLDRDGSGSERCVRCDGAGILDVGGFNTDRRCKTCDGSGKGSGGRFCHDCHGFGSVEAYEVQAKHGGWCPACRGTGATPVDEAPRRRTFCRSCGGKRVDRGRACVGCRNCLGTGEEPITAKPILGSSEAAGVQADDSALTRFAITSRRVERVRDTSPALAVALSVYYGDVGQRWALTEHGRIFSLYHLTPSGRRLARWGEHASKAADLGLTAQERIGAQAALEARQPKADRRALLDASGQQAADLYRRAARAWNKLSTTKRDRAAWNRLSGSLASLGYAELGEAVERHAKALP